MLMHSSILMRLNLISFTVPEQALADFICGLSLRNLVLNPFTSSFEPKHTCFELFDLWSVECIIPGNKIEERLGRSGGGKILPCKKGSGGGG